MSQPQLNLSLPFTLAITWYSITENSKLPNIFTQSYKEKLFINITLAITVRAADISFNCIHFNINNITSLEKIARYIVNIFKLFKTLKGKK